MSITSVKIEIKANMDNIYESIEYALDMAETNGREVMISFGDSQSLKVEPITKDSTVNLYLAILNLQTALRSSYEKQERLCL